MTTFDDLSRTVLESVATGKIGTPVSFRLHAMLPEVRDERRGPENHVRQQLLAAVAQAAAFAERVLQARPATLLARGDSAGRQLNVLINHAGGQTALITVACTAAPITESHLLVIGTHGVLRLEGAECFTFELSVASADSAAWQSAIEASLRDQTAVPLTE
jgi:predicted dehydrogenase